MRVFLIWSGEYSGRVADVLRGWLPSVLHTIEEPWKSEESIPKGQHWPSALIENFSKTDFAVVCVTAGSLHSPWVHFESGVVAARTEHKRVAPFLVGIEKSDLDGTPLEHFQATVVDKKDVLRLVRTINAANADQQIEPTRLEKTFAVCWPSLQTDLSNPPGVGTLKAWPQPGVAGPKGLKQEEEKILTFLATMPPSTTYPAAILAAQGFGTANKITVTRARYHLNRLLELGMVYLIDMGDPEYYASPRGIDYVVENGLLDDPSK